MFIIGLWLILMALKQCLTPALLPLQWELDPSGMSQSDCRVMKGLFICFCDMKGKCFKLPKCCPKILLNFYFQIYVYDCLVCRFSRVSFLVSRTGGSYRCLRTTIWAMRTELRSFPRVASLLNGWAIPSVTLLLVYFLTEFSVDVCTL